MLCSVMCLRALLYVGFSESVLSTNFHSRTFSFSGPPLLRHATR
jgi:hypothetical protein